MKHNSWLGGSCTCGSNVRRADDGDVQQLAKTRADILRAFLRAHCVSDSRSSYSVTMQRTRKRGAIFHAVYFKFECFLPLPAASTINPDACLVPFGATIRYPTFVYLLPSFFDQTITTIHPLDVSSACFEHTSG